MKVARFLLFTSFFLTLPLQAHGAGGGESLIADSMILKMIWALCIVVALILIIFGIARKKFGLGMAMEGKHIRILELRPMMNRTTLALVEVYDQKMLLGISNNDIRFLTNVASPPDQESFHQVLEKEQ